MARQGLPTRTVPRDPLVNCGQLLRDEVGIDQNALVRARRNDPTAGSLMDWSEAGKLGRTRPIGEIGQQVGHEAVAERRTLLLRKLREVDADEVPGKLAVFASDPENESAD